MKKQVFYRYLGTNGVLETPIHLEDIYYVRIFRISAEEGKILTDGNVKVYAANVSESELDNWAEIDEDN